MAPPPPLRGLAGGMMSMANQANVASTSQPYAASQTGIELMQDWNLFAYSGARAAPPCPGTTSSLALPSSPPPGRSSPNGPVQHLAMMEDPTAWLMEPLLMPIAAVSLEPMAPPTHSTGQNSPAPPAVDRQYSPLHGAENYNQHELVDCGAVQAQHEHHQQEPQAVVVDSADGYGATADGDAQMGSPLPPATGPEFHDSLCDLVDGTLLLELGDGIYIDFNDFFSDDETAPAPMMIDGGASGDGDAADGGDGGSQPHGDQCNGSQEQQDPCNN
ncbi:hypothetical protein E2562_031450 [Oryza meyeriana var. granulata]|uniref:Uncharacterized protein n=1 Tax=Oryza meyeriana var. granulata TaxID=110450 RepID=A0A6G1C0Y9_9ORYZ|nr:hypothetical protein E2562_031450 [Oryza meyeriana var. granulata]